MVGQKAVYVALQDGGGYMATILRDAGPIYHVRYDKVPLEQVANSERRFPAAWLAPNHNDVTDDFVHYARPLMGNDWPSIPLVDGRMRFSQLKPIFAEKKLAAYVPQAYRK